MTAIWQQYGRLRTVVAAFAFITLVVLWALAVPVNAADHGVIIVYHHVAIDTPASTSISPQMFRQHMNTLKENNFNVMALDDLVNGLRQGQDLAEKSVAITFDDAYISVYSEAFPLLQSLEFPFSVFISTAPVDNEQTGYMTWTQLQEMSSSGVLIGNHLVDHLYMLERLPQESEISRLQRLQQQLLTAESRIQTMTGQSHAFLAYPYGEYDPAIKEMIAELGFVGFGQNSGAIGWHSDFRALPRFPLAGIYANLESASLKFSTRAFHILELIPESSVTSDISPALELRFAEGNYDLDRLNCFANNQPVDIVWLDRAAGLMRMSPDDEFTGRRWSYTCTAPALDSSDFYWFSKPWVNPGVD